MPEQTASRSTENEGGLTKLLRSQLDKAEDNYKKKEQEAAKAEERRLEEIS